ncbi:MAG TPA: hypothetical protein RMH99_02340 [Sandaracinaceae bacterium LLY-WYZ-13_1]|nr:hypothetical protein [Sandaracinaceae bacterium LLY-WYZ-13_1]
MRRFVGFAGLALLVGRILAPSAARAQAEHDDYTRLGAHFALGLAGDAEVNAEGLETVWGLDPTLGFGARLERPVHPFVVLGGLFEMLAFDPDGRSDTQWIFDFDLSVRVRALVEIDTAVYLEPYAGLPVGFTLGYLFDPGDLLGDGQSVWPGWNIGAMGGLGLVVEGFSAYVEVGWRHHQVYSEVDTAFGSADWKTVTNQLAIRAGAALLLE